MMKDTPGIATPLPWKIYNRAIVDANDGFVIALSGGRWDVSDADAALIVHRVNHYEHLTAKVAQVINELRVIQCVAGQCSVEGPEDTKSLMAAAEAGRCGKWADELEALLVAEGRGEKENPNGT